MQYHQQTLCGPVLGDAAAMPHGDTQVSYGAGWAGCLLLHQPSGGLLRRRAAGRGAVSSGMHLSACSVKLAFPQTMCCYLAAWGWFADCATV